MFFIATATACSHSLSRSLPAKASVCSLPRSAFKSPYSHQLHWEQRGTHSAGMCRKKTSYLSTNPSSLFQIRSIVLRTTILKICRMRSKSTVMNHRLVNGEKHSSMKSWDGWLCGLCKTGNFHNKPKMLWGQKGGKLHLHCSPKLVPNLQLIKGEIKH